MLAQQKLTKKPGRWIRWLIIGISFIVVLLLLAYVGIGIYGANTFNQDSKRVRDFGLETPAKYGLNYQEVSFASSGQSNLTLRGWWVPKDGSQKALILVHGRDSNRTRLLPLSKSLSDSGYNLLYFDLQGQGQSDGDRYYFGQREKEDVTGAFAFVKSKGFSSSSIGVLGWSMGGSATLLALPLEPELKVVVTDSAYADFEKVAYYRFSRDYGLPDFLLPGIFASGKLLYGLDMNQTRPEVALQQVEGRRIFLIHGDKYGCDA
ncbi:MAG TPA: alpha/beta hydrolase [Chloroflexia bacterium]|nr:alpha/beta hydrolase [Chloroflexia bacterium]